MSHAGKLIVIEVLRIGTVIEWLGHPGVVSEEVRDLELRG